jgi:DNA polymerase (family 10)
MAVTNAQIAKIFDKIADLLEIKGENVFRVRAYRMAARTINDLSHDLNEMIKQGADLTELPGIGKDLAAKIAEIEKTGTVPLLENLKKEIPEELLDIMYLSGLGAKRVGKLFFALGIKNRGDLQEAAKAGKIRDLPGFGIKIEENILAELQQNADVKKRLMLYEVEQIVEPLLKYLRNLSGVKKVEAVGSLRRKKETIGDIDILAIAKDHAALMQKFIKYESVQSVLVHGENKTSVQLDSGLQVDLRVFNEESYGAAMLYFTGSKEHNVELRKIAIKKVLKLNEYGVFKKEENIASKTENEVYKSLGLSFIPPELREERGEIALAAKNRLPKLIELSDIRGDLHAHSNKTDGRMPIKEMAEAAKVLGYEYMALTDHSKHLAMAHGLDEKALRKSIAEIDELNSKFKKFTILKGIEVDILEDGTLDLDDDVLKELDIVVAAVHYKFNLSREKQTKRIIRAMDNKYMNILAHPTGRLINEREPYEIDIEKIILAAKERSKILELNSHPNRLDLNDLHCKMAKEAGVKIAISTDAHSINNFNLMIYGINQARRGWLEKDDVVNTRNLRELRSILNSSRKL